MFTVFLPMMLALPEAHGDILRRSPRWPGHYWRRWPDCRTKHPLAPGAEHFTSFCSEMFGFCFKLFIPFLEEKRTGWKKKKKKTWGSQRHFKMKKQTSPALGACSATTGAPLRNP